MNRGAAIAIVSLAISSVRVSTGAQGIPAYKDISWWTYGSSYANTRHVPTRQINERNVGRLKPVWRFVLGAHERVETTPLVVGHTMYATTGVGNTVVALDAATGKLKWRFRPVIGRIAACCGLLNRGAAVLGNRVFVATLDARLIALHAATGKPVWSVRVGNPARGFSETMAPLAWDGIVFIGSSGSDFGIRGSVTAYRAADGKRLWRWYAVSPGWEGKYVASVHGIPLHRDIADEKRDAAKYANSWQRGGGAVWITPALDPGDGTLYVSTGNPNPVFNGSIRPGDNLYTDSIVALDARSGKMRWFYQQTPHDVWEYEAASPPILFDARDDHGKSIPAVGDAGKTRWMYILRRTDGSLMRLSQSFVPNGDVYDPPPSSSKNAWKPQLQLRGTVGPIAYDPRTHFALITTIDRPSRGYWSDVLVAVDVNTGAIAWKQTLGGVHAGIRGDPMLAGAVSAGDLVFASDTEGRFSALRSVDGKQRWTYQLGGTGGDDHNAGPLQWLVHRVHDWLQPVKRKLMGQPPPTRAASVDTSPIAYELDGREYVAIGLDDLPDKAVGGAEICAFALPQKDAR